MGTAVGNGVALGSDAKFGLGVGVGIGSGVGTWRHVGVGCGVGDETGSCVGVNKAPGVDVAGSGGSSHANCAIGAKTHNNPIPTADLRGLRMLTAPLEPDISSDTLHHPQSR